MEAKKPGLNDAVKVTDNSQGQNWKRIAYLSLLSLAILFVAHAFYSYLNYDTVVKISNDLYAGMDDKFLLMVLAGFCAQLVDGALGMGYGVVSTSFLLSGGLNPAVISGSIHTAEMFSSGASGFSHYRFGNVNMNTLSELSS